MRHRRTYTDVRCNPKRRHSQHQTNSKTTDKIPTLRKIKRAATRHTSQPFSKAKKPFFANAPTIQQKKKVNLTIEQFKRR